VGQLAEEVLDIREQMVDIRRRIDSARRRRFVGFSALGGTAIKGRLNGGV
jgi:hypothetical protein